MYKSLKKLMLIIKFLLTTVQLLFNNHMRLINQIFVYQISRGSGSFGIVSSYLYCQKNKLRLSASRRTASVYYII